MNGAKEGKRKEERKKKRRKKKEKEKEKEKLMYLLSKMCDEFQSSHSEICVNV